MPLLDDLHANMNKSHGYYEQRFWAIYNELIYKEVAARLRIISSHGSSNTIIQYDDAVFGIYHLRIDNTNISIDPRSSSDREMREILEALFPNNTQGSYLHQHSDYMMNSLASRLRNEGIQTELRGLFKKKIYTKW